jgi:hypothetical protein
MKPPPGFTGSYNGLLVKAGDLVPVLPQDVEAHKAEGWELATETTITAPVAVAGGEE